MLESTDLFGHVPRVPPGFRYSPGLVSPDGERGLVERFRALDFRPFEFHGYTGNRRIVSYGWKYDYAHARLDPAAEIPDFLLALRETAAAFAARPATAFQQVLVTEYAPGAGIGWHRDKPMFGEIVGVSFLHACTFRLRRKNGAKWDRATVRLEPRSAYLLSGEARDEWEHSIPPVDEIRYSVTFRTFRDASPA
jgi:alkylated DNA repair dioxygenase AlkB